MSTVSKIPGHLQSVDRARSMSDLARVDQEQSPLGERSQSCRPSTEGKGPDPRARQVDDFPIARLEKWRLLPNDSGEGRMHFEREKVLEPGLTGSDTAIELLAGRR